jgi:hypothetical protein
LQRRYVKSQNRKYDLPLLRHVDSCQSHRHRSPAKPIQRAHRSNMV